MLPPGNWEEGYYSGEGVLTCHNGDQYEGTFSRGVFRGEGLYTYGNHRRGSSSSAGDSSAPTGDNKNSNVMTNNDNEFQFNAMT